MTEPSPDVRRRRTRRCGGVVVGLVGFLTLVSAISEPLRDRLAGVRHVAPIAVPEVATVASALAGLGLLVLARGVRRGQRRALVVTLALLAVTLGVHLFERPDPVGSGVAGCVGAFLLLRRKDFSAASERMSLVPGLLRWAAVLATTILAGSVGVELVATLGRLREQLTHHSRRPFSIGWVRAGQAVAERLVGVDHVQLPHALAEVVGPALAAAGLGLAAYLGVLVFRPVVARADNGAGLNRARAVVARYGSGTLDYFALRTDKRFFFYADTLVAYAVHRGVCLVSPDPIGPPDQREEAWRAFRAFADSHGWILGAVGAGEDWLPIYRSSGMHDRYVGDEAVVRIERFSLAGGRFKGLRQAVNRVARNGYTVSFHDPATIEAGLRTQLEEVMTKSRRGEAERGFSMTLGRAFAGEDEGLLLAVVHAPSGEGVGRPVAFCQYVPAPGIGGYSLDLMRRDDGEHPNGLIDFAVVSTIEYLRARGEAGLGLNFATMRAVLAGETGRGPGQRITAWVLRRMGRSMQIESLWRFNAKFDPDWQPRFVVFDAPEHALAVALAVARAESFFELPLIGRFLSPAGPPRPVVAHSAS